MDVDKLKNVLDDQGRKFKWFAEQIGVDTSTITRYMSGDTEIPKTKHKLIAKTLNVEMEDLV